MYISSIRLKSYSSFHDSGTATFKPGINIITGQNSVGKTSLLKVLDLHTLTPLPHKSTKTVPNRGSQLPKSSEILYGFLITAKDFGDIFHDFYNLPIHLAIPMRGDSATTINQINHWLSRESTVSISLNHNLNVDGGNTFTAVEGFGLGLFDHISELINGVFVMKPKLQLEYKGNSGGNYLHQSFIHTVFESAQKNTYRFDSERLNISRSQLGISNVLQSNARNLPEVLNNLQPEKASFERYNGLVRAVLPNVRWVSTHAVSASEVEIKVSPVDTKEDRSDISFPLQECGTGVGQVLAMLYVIQTSYTPKTIIIDEPSSFLHPGAEKALIEVFKQYPQHQYIIGTHSPLIITAAEPSTITKLVLSEDGQESTFESVNRDENEEIQGLLGNLGLSLSDIFGADSILWVEGPTELKCFPLLLRYVGKPLYRTQIAKVWQTSDLEAKNITELKRIVETYRHVSSGGSNSLAPKALGFFIDREDRSDDQISRMKQIERGKIGFTNYRHYENYLLHPQGISEVLNASDSSGETRVSVEQVHEYIETYKNEKKYVAQKLTESKTRPYLATIDAANLLKDIFSHFSEKRVGYQKTTHSVELTKWLLANDPEHLNPLIEELTAFIEQCKANF